MSTLAEQADARKEKLLALRKRKAEASTSSATNGAAADGVKRRYVALCSFLRLLRL